jgi:hypothetical protein
VVATPSLGQTAQKSLRIAAPGGGVLEPSSSCLAVSELRSGRRARRQSQAGMHSAIVRAVKPDWHKHRLGDIRRSDFLLRLTRQSGLPSALHLNRRYRHTCCTC